MKYEFPARGERGPVKMTWYDGGEQPRDLLQQYKIADKGSGVLFIGEKGALFADYSNRKLLPEEAFNEFQAPAKTIPDSVGHHREWLNACRTGSTTTCNFSYGAALTETALLGNVAYRAGAPIEWDSTSGKVTNITTANQFVRREYRKGWTL